jgi:hypothetical protein
MLRRLLLLTYMVWVAGCGAGQSDKTPSLVVAQECPKGQVDTSSRDEKGQETLRCVTKCWQDWQCGGDDGRCHESVCVSLECIAIKEQTECTANKKCYWHLASGPRDSERCGSSFDADISQQPVESK